MERRQAVFECSPGSAAAGDWLTNRPPKEASSTVEDVPGVLLGEFGFGVVGYAIDMVAERIAVRRQEDSYY
jgi:hypothetical protein